MRSNHNHEFLGNEVPPPLSLSSSHSRHRLPMAPNSNILQLELSVGSFSAVECICCKMYEHLTMSYHRRHNQFLLSRVSPFLGPTIVSYITDEHLVISTVPLFTVMYPRFRQTFLSSSKVLVHELVRHQCARQY